MKLALPLLVAIAALCAWYFLRSGSAPPRDPVQRGVADATLVAPAPELRADELPPVDDAPRRDVAPALPQEAAPLGATEERRAPDARAVRVRVLDRERTPLADMRVVVSMEWPRHPTPIASATTGTDGTARIAWGLVHSTSESLAVSVEGPFDPSHVVSFPLSEPPDHVIELVVDPGGTLEVLVRDGTGRALAGVDVRVAPRELLEIYPGWAPGVRASTPWSAHAETDVAGIARVAPVGAESDLAVQVREKDAVEAVLARAKGPRAGETRRVEVVFDANDVILVGAIALGDGARPGGWAVNVLRQDATPAFSDWQIYPRPAAESRFRLRVSPAQIAALPTKAWLLVSDGRRPAAFFDLRSLRSTGEHDLGTIRSPAGTVLFAGVARHEDGTPHVGPLAIEIRPDTAWFAPAGIFGVTSDAEGRFLFEGVGESRIAWRIRPATPGAVLVGPEEVVPGDEDIDLVLRAGPPPAMVRGRIVLDTGGENGGLAERLVVTLREHGRVLGHLRTTPQADGTFVLGPIRRGGDVTVGVPWHEGAIARAADAVPADGVAPGDEVVFDLRGRLAFARITALGPDDGAVRFRLRPLDAPAATPMTDWFEGGDLVVVHDTPLEVIASAPGLSDVRASLVPGDNRIRFERAALSVRLVWNGAPEVAVGRRLRPILVRVEDLAPVALRDIHAEFLDGAAFDEGVARVRAPGPGRYAVLLQLERATTHMREATVFKTEVPGPEIAVEDSGREVEFSVQWDSAAVLAALEGFMR